MKSAAKDPESLIAAIPPERRVHIEKLRALIKKSVPKAREGILWGMLGFTINERPFVGLAAQKNYLSLYLMDLYVQPGLRESTRRR
jgi:uncharacterized protein YdhG (YjbR/CyaY superfamily)